MMIYRGRKPFVRLDEMAVVERAVFSVWLLGIERPTEEEDAAWLEDYLRFLKQRKEVHERRRSSG